MGGLGNQLFQIFTGISHGLDNKTAFRIKFSKSDMISPVDGISKRPTYWDNFLKTVSRFTYRDRPLNTPVLREKAAFQYNKLPSVESDFILWGYYQSFHYFNHNLDTIKRLLNIDINRHNTKTQFHHYFPDASNNNNNKKPISMHFRIGDYAKASHVHPILDVKYYMEALNLLNSKLENLSTGYYILYFFEEQDRDKVADIIKELSDRFPEIEFKGCDTEIEDWQQMLLMSLSSHNILANSTFSWWGAYLNTDPEKVVIYPSKWINTHHDLNDLFPSDWIKIKEKKCAICLRGRCLDDNLEINQFGISKQINYNEYIASLFEKIINNNPNIEFDFYLHGWISDSKYINNIINDYKPLRYILEPQINFSNEYINIKKFSNILKERYKHLHKINQYNYDNIHFQNYFQNIFSYAYSISKVMKLIKKNIDYDYVIHLRYDIIFNEFINLEEFNYETIYTDDIGIAHSPLFHGDFIYCSNKHNSIIWKNFYSFLKKNIFNNDNYIKWVKYIIDNKNNNCKGRYEHGIYSNQMIYAYFINKNNIDYENIIPKIKCKKTM